MTVSRDALCSIRALLHYAMQRAYPSRCVWCRS